MVRVSISVTRPKFKVRKCYTDDDVALEVDGWDVEITIYLSPKQAKKLVEKINKVLEEIEKLRKCMKGDC